MKKTASLFFFIICLTLVFSVTAFAESSSTSLTDNAAMGSHVTNSGMSSAYGNNNYGTNYTGTGTNNYRANATTATNNSNWGWLGLLGLAGLAGLRSRDRERT